MKLSRIISNIKEFALAYYDPKTDKIYYARYGTLSWYHEKRHQMQYKELGYKEWINAFHIVGYSVSSGFIIVTLINLDVYWLRGIALAWLPYTILLLWFEIDACMYSLWERYIKRWLKGKLR